MAEFVALTSWLHLAEPEPAVEEPPIVLEEPSPAVEVHAADDERFDDVCARVRRFAAMLADASDYVQQRGEPREPLRIRVHPSRFAQIGTIGLPSVADAQLDEDEAVIELRCGSIDTELYVPLRRLLAQSGR